MRRTWNQLLHLLLLLPCAAAMCAQQELLSSNWSSIATVQSPFEVSYVRLVTGHLETKITLFLQENGLDVARVILNYKNDRLYLVQTDFTSNGIWENVHTGYPTFEFKNLVKLSLSYSGKNFNVTINDSGKRSSFQFSSPEAPTNGSGNLSIRAQANSKYLVYLPCHLNTEPADGISCVNSSAQYASTLWLVISLLAVFAIVLAGILVFLHCFCRTSSEKAHVSEGTGTLNETNTMEEEHVYEELE